LENGVSGEMTFEEWVETVPDLITGDPLWKSVYYQQAMYLYDLIWQDCELLMKDIRGREISKQLIRSAGSVCANIEEAYGRGIESADALRILRIALGEGRETRGWYLRSRYLLSEGVLNQRLDLTTQIISQLVNAISNRRQALRR
jgi:four helix bundle protein